MMCIGRQRRSLPRLEVHDVRAHLPIGAHRTPVQFLSRLVCLRQQRQAHPEAPIRCLRSCNRLKDQVHRCTRFERRHLCRHMRQHAALHRNLKSLPERVNQSEQLDRRVNAVSRRIDPDHRIARSQQQPIQNRRSNAHRIVGGMIRLQPCAQRSRQANSRAKARHHANLRGRENQILHAHQLAHRRGHLRRDSRRQGRDQLRRRLIRKQPVAQFSNSQRPHRRKRLCIVRVKNQTRNFVVLASDNRLREKLRQRHIGQRKLGRHTLLGRPRRHARQHIAAAQAASPWPAARAGCRRCTVCCRCSKRRPWECFQPIRKPPDFVSPNAWESTLCRAAYKRSARQFELALRIQLVPAIEKGQPAG